MHSYDPVDSVATMSQPEFDLVLHAVELVVLSQAFNEMRLGLALRVSSSTAHRLTLILEQWRVIGEAEYDGDRRVVAAMRDLTSIVYAMREQRGAWVSAA